jgi:tetratricopeptide (TPR) repeat protein
MSIESPPRLSQDAELGPILKASDSPPSPDRLASNHAAIKAAIAAGVAKSLPLWLKITLPLLLLAGSYVLYRGLTRETAPLAAPLVATPVITVDAAAPVIAIDAAEAVIEIDAAPVVVAVVKKSKPVVVEPPPEVPPPSDLPAQIALYEQARAAAAAGDVARGIALLDELFAKYPATQLRAEAELTRAEYLTRANRLDDAASALDALIASPSHRGRRGELWRALGDLRRKQGDCRRAIDAYTHAREHALSTAETAKVDRGLESCAVPAKKP